MLTFGMFNMFINQLYFVCWIGEPSHGGTGSLTEVYVETFNHEETDCLSKPTKQKYLGKVL